MHHAFKIGESEYEVELSRGRSMYRLHFEGAEHLIDLSSVQSGLATLRFEDFSSLVYVAMQGDDVFVHLDGAAYQLRYEHPLDRLAQTSQGAAADSVRAPMPGSVIAVRVKAGQTITRGETLLVMESMKMETTITAPRDGVIETIHFAAGQTFDRDALLLELKRAE